MAPYSNSKVLDIVAEGNGMAPAVVVVTPYSTGCCVALEAQQRGYKLICLWSAGFAEEMKLHVPLSCQGKLHYEMELNEQPTLDETAALVQEQAAAHSLHLVSCICGGEAGVDLADALSEYLGMLTNGTKVANRRDKKVQQELIKVAGLRAVRQCAGKCLADVQDFLESESYPVIVKPLDSAGSDGVKKCDTYEDAVAHFELLTNGYEKVNGGQCEEVLCQEFLKGKEYIVDHISRDGQHKTCMIWLYDKRHANGAAFVYFGEYPVDSESPEAKVLIPYVRAVLDVLGIANGPSHGEVIITKDGPCLVEMNCRANGGNGTWQPLCQAIAGYSQVEAAVDAYLEEDKFARLPDKYPSPFLAEGQLVDLVSFSSGIVKSTPGFDVLKKLPSCVFFETHVKDGVKVVPTVDLVTDIGCVVMMNSNKKALERDVELIREMEKHNLLFEYYREVPESHKDEDDDDDNEGPNRFVMLKDRRRIYSLDFKTNEDKSRPFIMLNRERRGILSMDVRDVYNH
jgi:biotin carboxylase